MVWIFIVAGLLIMLGLYLSWTAGRLDRIHARVDASKAVLEAELLRRSSGALDIASAGFLDPASSVVLSDAASHARTNEDEQAQSDLSSVLGAMFGDEEEVAELREDPAVASALDELGATCRRAAHARRFHNGIVRGAQRLRRKRLVRWFGLAGHAPWPETMEFDDAIPPALSS